MKQTILKQLFIAFSLLISMSAFAVSTTIDGIRYELNLNSRTASVTGSSLAEVVVPATIVNDGITFTVTSIASCAFESNKTIKSFKAANTIRIIGESAFCYASNLQKVDFGNNVETIQSSAFKGCTSLKYIVLPASIQSVVYFSFYDTPQLNIICLREGFYTYYSSQTIYPSSFFTFSDNTFVYNGVKPEVTYTFNGIGSGFQPTEVNMDNLEKTAGTHTTNLSCTFENSDMSFTVDIPYTYTITPVALTARVKDATRAYGDANPQFQTEYSGFITGENEAVITNAGTYSTSATAKSDVGTYSVSLSGASAQNYTFTYEPGTLTVIKAPLTMTARDKTMDYGARVPTLEADYAGLKNNETKPVWITQPTIATTATSTSNAGTYPITITGGVTKNYAVTFREGTLTVNKISLTATTQNATRVYGDDNPAFELTYSGLKNGETAPGWIASPTISTPATKTSPVGTYDITATGGEARNYMVQYVNKGKLTVTKAPLTATARSVSRLQGEANPTFIIDYAGFKHNETVLALTQEPIATTTATQNSRPGTYPITVSGGEAPNYDFCYVNGTLTVLDAPELQPGTRIEVANEDGKIIYYEVLSDKQLMVTYRGTSPEAYLNEYIGTVNIPMTVNYNGETYSVVSIGEEAFFLCESVTNITLPNGLMSIGRDAFTNTKIESLYIPKSVIKINTPIIDTWNVCSIKVDKLNPVYDSRNGCNAVIETATNSLIMSCKAMGENIPEGVEILKTNSVDWVPQKIVIPASVKKIERWSITGHNELVEIRCKAVNPPVCEEQAIFSSPTTYIENCCSLIVPKGTIEAYKKAYFWKNFVNIVEEDGQINDCKNVLSMANFTANTNSQTDLYVQLTNEQQITGLQFDLYLPTGVSVATKSNGKMLIETTYRMFGNYSISSNTMDGFVRILGYSADGDAFADSDGDILKITLNIADDMADGDYTIRIKDIVLSDVDNTEYHPADVEATLTVKSYTLGDVDNSGAININDVVCIINHILNRTNGTFIAEAADVDGNGAVNINDVVTLINRYILNRTNTPALPTRVARRSAMEDNNYLHLGDISIKPGETKEVQMLMTNADEVRAIQGNIKLPTGLTFVTKSNGRLDMNNVNVRSEDFTLSCAVQDDGSMTFTQYSADGFAYEGKEGGIFTFKVKADDNATAGTYNVNLTGVVLSINGVGYDIPDRVSSLTITDAMGIQTVPGDCETSSDTIYNLSGQRMTAPQKGLNIINGKKVVMK